MTKNAVALLALVAILGGCLDRSPSDSNPGNTGSFSASATGSSTSVSSTMTTTGTQQPTPLPLQLILNNCTGWAAVRNYLGPTAPGPRPAGWEPASSATEPITGISIQAFRCNRIAIGEFERGPLNVLYEYHSNAVVPDACQMGLAGLTNVGILTALLINDAEIVAFLNDQLGVPAFEAVISDTVDSAGPGAVHSWSWRVADGPDSMLVLPDSGDDSNVGGTPERLFWERAGRLHQADLVLSQTFPPAPGTATGTIHPPFYAASDSGNAFAALGTPYKMREASAAFTSYDDMECG